MTAAQYFIDKRTNKVLRNNVRNNLRINLRNNLVMGLSTKHRIKNKALFVAQLVILYLFMHKNLLLIIIQNVSGSFAANFHEKPFYMESEVIATGTTTINKTIFKSLLIKKIFRNDGVKFHYKFFE